MPFFQSDVLYVHVRLHDYSAYATGLYCRQVTPEGLDIILLLICSISLCMCTTTNPTASVYRQNGIAICVGSVFSNESA